MRIDVPVPVESLVVDPMFNPDRLALEVRRLNPREKVELIEAVCLCQPQVEIPVQHTFSPGVYVRTITFPEGTLIVGHEHKREHLTALFSGKVDVVVDGQRSEFTAPCVFNTLPGQRKVIYAHSDSVLANIHHTDSTDIDEIEDELILKSETFKLHQLGRDTDLMSLARRIVKSGHTKALLEN